MAYFLKNQDIASMSAIGLFVLIGFGALAHINPRIIATCVFGYAVMVAAYWFLRPQIVKTGLFGPISTDEQTYRVAVQIIDTMPQAMAIISQDGILLHANLPAKDMMKIEKTGEPFSTYIDHPHINNHLAKALTGHAPDPLMLHIESPREQYITVIFSAAHDVSLETKVKLTFVVFEDVTDINIEQQRRADFLANASHELKTPVASLRGYIETLRGHAKDDPAAQAKFLGIMQKQAERMQRLIDDLLSLRKIELTEHIAPSEVADLHLAITAAIEAMTPVCEQRRVNIVYNGIGKNYALVHGKQDECVQLFLNLIENASKISAPGSAIYVHLRSLEKWSPMKVFEDARLPSGAPSRQIVNAISSPLPAWLITISDSGPGFAREHISRIGERFYRIAGDVSSKDKGTGLGLAIVKHIVKRHRGGLYVQSIEGTGTDFSILLIAADNSNETARPITMPNL